MVNLRDLVGNGGFVEMRWILWYMLVRVSAIDTLEFEKRMREGVVVCGCGDLKQGAKEETKLALRAGAIFQLTTLNARSLALMFDGSTF